MKPIKKHPPSKINRQSFVGLTDCYLQNLPAILQYPSLQESHIEIIKHSISEDDFDTGKQALWQDIRLILLEPEWLRTKQRNRFHQIVFNHIIENEQFIQQILSHYELVSLFEQTPHHQESLLLSMSGLQQFIGFVNPNLNLQIHRWTNSIIESVRLSPLNWEPMISGATWLIEELQIEEGTLYDGLSTLAQISIPQNSKQLFEERIGLWARQHRESNLLNARDQKSQLDGIIRGEFSRLGRFPLK